MARRPPAGMVWTAVVLGIPLFAPAAGLEDYVQQGDAAFAWKERGRKESGGVVITELALTSQTWRGGAWTHQLLVFRPAAVRNPDLAFLLIEGDGAGGGPMNLARLAAERGGALAAILTRVPNQPLYDGRREDGLIAYTFVQQVQTGDDTWPLLYPMVKSAVRAMDAVTAWAQTAHTQTVRRFVVSGASKRGWTTWLAAAVDPRIKAIAPMVFDMLNMKAQTDWAQRCYGRQSEKIHNYTDLDLVKMMDHPGMVKLRGQVDPYSFRQRYTMPKLVLLGTNDRYWTVDALRHYWDDLPGPKLVYQTPNGGHDLAGGRQAHQTIAAFFQMIADGQELPRLEWQVRGADKTEMRVTASRAPAAWKLWTAESSTRDFRDARWSANDLPSGAVSTETLARVALPATGYRAYLVEATLASDAGAPYRLSTQVQVVPDRIEVNK